MWMRLCIFVLFSMRWMLTTGGIEQYVLPLTSALYVRLAGLQRQHRIFYYFRAIYMEYHFRNSPEATSLIDSPTLAFVDLFTRSYSRQASVCSWHELVRMAPGLLYVGTATHR